MADDSSNSSELDYNKILLKIGEFGPWQRKAIVWLMVPAFVAGLVSIFTIMDSLLLFIVFLFFRAYFSCPFCSFYSSCFSCSSPSSPASPFPSSPVRFFLLLLLLLQVVMTGLFAAFTPEPTGFNCTSTSICTDPSSSVINQADSVLRLEDIFDRGPEEVLKKHKEPNDCFPREKGSDSPACEKRCDSSHDFTFDPDKNVMRSSVVSDTRLMCSETLVNAYQPICNSFFMIGYFLGGSLFGMVADTHGRKPAIFLSMLFCLVGTALGPLVLQLQHTMDDPSPLAWLYALLRIIPGAGSIGAYLMAFTLCVELVGKKEQFPGIPWNVTVFSVVGNIIGIPYALGEMTNSLLAYVFPEWITFQLLSALLCGLPLLLWFCVPESPRWLIERNRTTRVRRLLRKAAKDNGAELPDSLRAPLKSDTISTSSEDTDESMFWEEGKVSEEAKDAFWDRQKGLFHPSIRSTTIVLMILWIFMSLIYYGTSFLIEDLHIVSSAHLALVLVMTVEIPAYLVSALTMSSLGRKPLLIFNMLLIALVCSIGTGLLGEGWHSNLLTVCVLTAKFCISSVFSVTRIYTSEIYPTHIRATALGFMKSVSCLGSILSPWAAYYVKMRYEEDTGRRMTLVIFSICAAIGGGASFLLADTTGFALPENFEDIHRIKRDQKKLLSVVGADWRPGQQKEEEEA